MQTMTKIKETALNAGLTKEFVRFFGGGDLRQKQTWLKASDYVFNPETETVSVDVIPFGDFSKFLPDWPQKPVQIPVPEPEPDPEGEPEPESDAGLITEPENDQRTEDFEPQSWKDWELVSRYPDYEDDRFRFMVPIEDSTRFFLDWIIASEIGTIVGKTTGNSSWASLPCFECATHFKPWEVLELALALDATVLPRAFPLNTAADIESVKSVSCIPLEFNPVRGFASRLPYCYLQGELVVVGTGCGFAPAVEIPIAKPSDDDFFDTLHPRDRAIAQELRSEFGAVCAGHADKIYVGGWGDFSSPWEEVDLGHGWRSVIVPGRRLSCLGNLAICSPDGVLFYLDYEDYDDDLTTECELAIISSSIDSVATKWGEQFGSQLSIDFAA